MKIKYEVTKHGICQTICPYAQKDDGISTSVGSFACQNCIDFLGKDKVNHVVQCSNPNWEGTENGWLIH
jgi:hypothetical protein